MAPVETEEMLQNDINWIPRNMGPTSPSLSAFYVTDITILQLAQLLVGQCWPQYFP